MCWMHFLHKKIGKCWNLHCVAVWQPSSSSSSSSLILLVHSCVSPHFSNSETTPGISDFARISLKFSVFLCVRFYYSWPHLCETAIYTSYKTFGQLGVEGFLNKNSLLRLVTNKCNRWRATNYWDKSQLLFCVPDCSKHQNLTSWRKTANCRVSALGHQTADRHFSFGRDSLSTIFLRGTQQRRKGRNVTVVTDMLETHGETH